MADTMTMTESTRVFVSGLPSTLTTDQLASHFRTQYKVTDAHVMPDRRIGFVGFHDSETAQSAVKYFNRSFIRMSRINVDLAKPIEVKHNHSGQSVPVTQREFRENGKRSNRDVERSQQNTEPVQAVSISTATSSTTKRKRDIRDDGEQARSEPKSSVVTPDNQESRAQDDTTQEPTERALEDPRPQPSTSDGDWLRGRISRLLDLVDHEDIIQDQTPRGEVRNTLEVVEREDLETEEQAITNTQVQRGQSVPNARLFIRNLAFDVTETDLTARFGGFGKIQEAHIVKDNRKSTSKGMAYIQFSENEAAEAALQSMDGVAFHGRLLHVLPASDKREQPLTDFEISKLPLKKQKALRRKLDAGTAVFSWNSLYMNPDAVLTSIAQRLGIAKSEILDPTSADAAVKQAHAETQVIAETKEYFKANGINLDALKSSRRDDRSLLLKNFPFGITEQELRDILEPFGQISKFMLPPAGTMAIVQFTEQYFASQAMKSLAYKNIKGSVLYLEKAPEGLLVGQENHTVSQTPAAAPSISAASNTGSTGKSTSTATVFVRNLNFSTTTPRLTEVFSPLSGFLSARVKTRTEPKRPGEILSMGFGFVEFNSSTNADAAIASMNGYRLDGHNLLVKLSVKNTDIAEEQRKDDINKKIDANRTKILIKNLPFQTTRKDVRSLFAQYGQLKTIRVPKKFDNTSRGFGFAEFITAKEAESAMEALANTHLLGRKLVLEFAQEETIDPEAEITAVEKKMEQQSQRFNISKLTGTGRRKFNVENGQEDA